MTLVLLLVATAVAGPSALIGYILRGHLDHLKADDNAHRPMDALAILGQLRGPLTGRAGDPWAEDMTKAYFFDQGSDR